MSFEIAIDIAEAYIRIANDLCEWLRKKGYECEIRALMENRRQCNQRIYIAPFHTTRHNEVFARLQCDVEDTIWITDTEGLPIFQNEEQLNFVNSLELLLSPGSNFSANKIKEAGVMLPMKIVPRTVSHEKITSVKPANLKFDYIIFIAASYWGMKHQRKGIEEAYEAMRIVNRKHPKLVLYHLTTNYPEAIGIKIPQRTHIFVDQNYGFKKYEEVISLIKGARLLIAPSHCEGWNLPALEAMACKTPLVYTDVPAQNEFAVGEKVPTYGVEHEMTKYGILNELHLFKSEDLSQAILNVYENSTYAEELAEKAYEKSLEYNQNKVFPRYFDKVFK